MVGLFELADPAPDDDRHANLARANRGEACLVFHAPDIAKIHRSARRMGLRVLCPPTRLEIPQLGVVSIEMTLRDPNDVLLNFIQTVEGRGLGLLNHFPGLRKPALRRRSGASRRRRSG
jgi:hypothetical protein